MTGSAKVTSLVLCALALGGCVDNFGQYVSPAAPPGPAEVRANFESFEIAWTALSARVVPQGATNGDKITAEYFVTHGYDLASTNCILFFDKIRNLRNETSFTKDLLVSIASASGVITGLAGASAAVLTGIIGGTGIIPSAVDSFNKTFLLSDIADSVSPQIMAGMADFRDKNKPEQATRFTAADMVREHARICTIPFMIDVAKKGAANTKIETVKPLDGSGKDVDKDKPRNTVMKEVPKADSSTSSKVLGLNGRMAIIDAR